MSLESELRERLQALPEERRDTTEHADLLNALAGELLFTDPSRAGDLLARAETLSHALGHRKGLAYSENNRAFLYYQMGRHEEALRACGMAMAFFLESGDRRGQADAASCLGLVYWGLGDYEKAVRYGQESLRLYEETESHEGAGWALTSLGGVYLDTGDHSLALSLHERSLALFRKISDRLGEGRALTGMGTVYQAQGKYELALAQHQRSLEIYKTIGNRLSESRALNDIGAVYQATGDLDKALEHHLEALRLRQELGNRQAETTSLINLGRLFNQKGDPERALSYLRPALLLSTEVGARPKMLQAYEALSQSYALSGQYASALDHHREFHRIKEEVAGEESSTRLKNAEIRHGVERAEKEAEIERLRNVELAEALERLKATQAQLVHAAKMASLGDLVAGLVHEIATPAGAIQASADVSQRSLQRLQSDLGELSQVHARTLQAIELNHRTIRSAGARLARLTQSLKTYARLDESEFQRADIEEGIEAALDLLTPKLGDRIEAVREFARVPPVECYPSQLHQAFMTILVNAVESIDGQGMVTVKTWCENGDVAVRIADTGRGIPEGRLPRIFEVGFSEKESRMRMRVGLSNAHTIVHNHGGSITVESEIGKGTAFTIRLPRTYPVA